MVANVCSVKGAINVSKKFWDGYVTTLWWTFKVIVLILSIIIVGKMAIKDPKPLIAFIVVFLIGTVGGIINVVRSG